jgi:hypothetical protein
VSIDGTSSVHDWRVVGRLIGGYLEFDKPFSAPAASAGNGTLAVRGECFIPVRSLASVEADGRPFSSRMDDTLYEALREAHYRRIAYYPTVLVMTNHASTEPDREALSSERGESSTPSYLTAGELVVAGVTNQIQLPVTITPHAGKEGSLKISGSVTVKMTDFKIKPPQPALAGGLMKVGDPVVLSFDWVVAPPRPRL